ncbi:MAG TPA: hydroxysqualene dehydroxylase HpnE [Acidimicrobiales bacterium]|nr:hydroxysqualene dehydroxylase HpnE [Acidimicrobiales bacterium]
MNRPRVVVAGGGLAGITAALECADAGAHVTLVEKRTGLGGLTRSFRHGDLWLDNGQHVFLRCCTEYLSLLYRIGAADEVELQDRLDIPVVSPARNAGGQPVIGNLRRSGWPVPLHLAGSLVRYPHLGIADRLKLGRAVLGLSRLRLDDPALDLHTFASWLRAHHQSDAAITALWDLITVPTVNLPAAQASLTMAAKVFKTGLLSESSAADIGWSRVPLGRLHGERAAAALEGAGVEVRTGERVRQIRTRVRGGFEVLGDGWSADADGVVVAVPHDEVGALLPQGSVRAQERLGDLGTSAVVDVHLVLDRRVTEWPVMSAVGSTVQWVFDRTSSSGLTSGQLLAVSLSAADALLPRRPEDIASEVQAELARLLPSFSRARVVDSVVTKERHATFKAVPGTAALRPPAATSLPGLAVAGAWTDTGWPATMEGAVRSGTAAARACLAGAGRALRDRSLAGAGHEEEVA